MELSQIIMAYDTSEKKKVQEGIRCGFIHSSSIWRITRISLEETDKGRKP
jgi:hypothetical protein